LTATIPDELYRQVKARSALLGKRVRDVTIELYRRWPAETDSPSSETPDEWLAEWVRLGETSLQGAPPGPTATEILQAGRDRSESRSC